MKNIARLNGFTDCFESLQLADIYFTHVRPSQLGALLTGEPEDPDTMSDPATYSHLSLPLIQEGQLSVTGKSMETEYWLTALEVKACPGIVWLG